MDKGPCKEEDQRIKGLDRKRQACPPLLPDLCVGFEGLVWMESDHTIYEWDGTAKFSTLSSIPLPNV